MKINIQFFTYGHFKISITYRRKVLTAVTTNTRAIDRYKDDTVSEKTKQYGYTRKQAAIALRKEILLANA